MMAALVCAGVLAAAALIAAWRSPRGAWWRTRIGGQFIAAILLWLILFPIGESQTGGTLVVLTAGADARGAANAHEPVVALPGVEVAGRVTRVPDLASGLRRHPGTTRLLVIGDGLGLRDREAAHGLDIAFDPPALSRGVVELGLPDRVAAGATWRVSGTVADVAGGRVELRDRSDALIATQALAEDGRFELDARAKLAGRAQFELRVIAADDARVETLPLPLFVDAGAAMRVVLIAGAPDAELRAVRRWAADAGIAMSSRIALSRGIALRDGEVSVDAQRLGETDLVIIDERAWASLGRAEKDTLLEAVERGLGLFLRVTGPLPESVLRDWADLGIRLSAADVAQSTRLPALAGTLGEPVGLMRRPLRIEADDGVALLSADDGSTLAVRVVRGHGRVGVSILLDSPRLAQAGDSQRFGALWSRTFSVLARARGVTAIAVTPRARVDQRSSVCGIAEGTHVEAADGTQAALRIDPRVPGCAAWWPQDPGWHVVVDGESRHPVFVWSAIDAIALARAETIQATAHLAGDHAGMTAATSTPARRGWIFLIWLAIVGALWWIERRVAASYVSEGRPPA